MSKAEMPKAYEPASIEEKWYSYWEENRLFHGEAKPGKKPYSIVIPPPNVTGILTMGHVLNNTLQDILIRWHRMMGEEVCWFPGTDHAGIATESKVDKVLRETEGVDRRTLSVGVCQNVLCHKYLSDSVAVDREELVVYLHKLALTDRRHSLLDLGRVGDSAKAELCNARADRSRGDENDLNARVLHVREDLDELFNSAQVEVTCCVSEC